MASGVKIDDEVKEVYQQISMTTSKSTKLKCAIFCFSPDCKKIIVEKKWEVHDAPTYDEFIQLLPPDGVRYAIYDFEYINKDGCRKSEMGCVSWHPDKCKIKDKMLCASSLSAFKSCLGISKNIMEADSYSDISSEAWLEKFGGKAIPT